MVKINKDYVPDPVVVVPGIGKYLVPGIFGLVNGGYRNS
jgi:hypothetical protein